MSIVERAIEISGTIGEDRKLILDGPLPISGPKRAKVIILVQDDDIDENEWRIAVKTSASFDFLNDPKEDIYTLEDGEPFVDEG
ncbi:MAG: hypothetical protein NUW37_17405 [Planctomycetes bacterium]|nr:hypothetical protein [Planctomycetota bacterium]